MQISLGLLAQKLLHIVLPVVSHSFKCERICFVVLNDLSKAKSLENVVDSLRSLMILYIVELALEHAPCVLYSLCTDEGILFVHINVRVVDPEVIPAIPSQV